MSTKVLIVCDSFKESLVASDVAKAIARGIGAADAAARSPRARDDRKAPVE